MRALLFSLTLVTVLMSRVALAQDATGAPPAPAGAQPPVAAQTGTVQAPGSPDLKAASVCGILPWGGFGIGGRYLMPVGIPRLLSKTRFMDGWALEFGADYLHWSYSYGAPGISSFDYSWSEFLPVVGMMWQFWVNESFAVYPKAEAGWAFGWYSNAASGATGLSGGGGPYASGAVGLIYKFTNAIAGRAEAGYSGLKAGVAFVF